MRVVVSGATGLIGRRIVARLRERGDEVVALGRDAPRIGSTLGAVEAHVWEPLAGPPPAVALRHADAVVHLAGEPVSQRWSAAVKRRIHDSRVVGTENLVIAIAALDPAERPLTLACASATGYYGPRGDERVTETAPAGSDFLATVCTGWERAADGAAQHGVRVCRMRTGFVLDSEGGALPRMLKPFRLGLGGPVAGGRQYVPWVHSGDVAGLYLRALDDESWSGPYNACAPEPVTNAALTKALGRAVHRPTPAPVPGGALRLLYGEMAEIVIGGQRAVPQRPLDAGYPFAFSDIDRALADTAGAR